MPAQPTADTADTSVRVAWSGDADALAEVQAEAWRQAYADLLPAEALVPRPEAWRALLTRPSDGRQRVLVALERHRAVGFTLTLPASDPDCDPVADGEVADLTVLAGHRRRGHGSRLLQAAADTLRADRFTRAVTWVVGTDDELRGFLQAAGWAPDSAHRRLDVDGTGLRTVAQVRLHTALTD